MKEILIYFGVVLLIALITLLISGLFHNLVAWFSVVLFGI